MKLACLRESGMDFCLTRIFDLFELNLYSVLAIMNFLRRVLFQSLKTNKSTVMSFLLEIIRKLIRSICHKNNSYSILVCPGIIILKLCNCSCNACHGLQKLVKSFIIHRDAHQNLHLSGSDLKFLSLASSSLRDTPQFIFVCSIFQLKLLSKSMH